MTASDAPTAAAPGLIADIGGTNARFALVKPDGGWHDERVYAAMDYASPLDAARAYLEEVRPATPPRRAAICVACPVLGDDVRLTNSPWHFSIAGMRQALGLDRLKVVNDFVANALACPRLSADDVARIGDATTRPGFPIAAIGPGTGLGVALLVPDGQGGWLPVATEGGHVTLPAVTAREREIVDAVAARVGHVSAERLISGAGLALLHETLQQIEGVPVTPLPPEEITARALHKAEPTCVEALTLFCGFLGTVAGNLALTTGALGGVYLLGGILPQMVGFLRRSPFRERFTAKGRFSVYLDAVPTEVVIHPYPAFLGLEGLLE